MLNRLPSLDAFTLNPSPLVRWGVQRIHWLHRRPKPFAAYRRRAAFVIVAFSLCLTVILYRVFNTPYSLEGEGLISAGGILTVFSLVVGTLFDLLPIASVARHYKRDTIHHDLLRVSPLSVRSIVAAYHELACIDSWRSVTSLSLIRLAGMLLLLIGILANYLDNRSRYSAVYFDPYTVTTLLTIACFVVVALIITVEPRWRIRAMSALAMAVAVRIQQEWLRLIVNMLLVLVHWLLFPIILGLISFFVFNVATFESFALPFIVLPIALYGGLRIWYAWITQRSLAYAAWRMFRQYN